MFRNDLHKTDDKLYSECLVMVLEDNYLDFKVWSDVQYSTISGKATNIHDTQPSRQNRQNARDITFP
jgi:hypothetical protein